MIKVSLVLALGLLATMLLRRRSAALRHWVLAATILGAAGMPLAEAVAPAWRLPLLPARASGLAPALTLGDAPGREAAPAAGVTQVIAASSSAVLPLLRTAWLLGAGLSLVLLGAGIARLLVVASRARPMTAGRWVDEAAALVERAGMARRPEILQTSHATLLFTWGLRQPKVLVPRDADTWSDQRIRIVLGHELAHVRRGDWAVQLLADCVRSAYWFNPLAWIACWRLRLESEHACDDAVLRLGVAAPDYASQLLDLARLFRHSRRSLFPAPAMARPSDLERRVRVMLNERTDRSPVGRLSGWLVALVLVALTAPIAGLSLSAVRDDVPPGGVSPRIADVVLPAAPVGAGAPAAPVAAAPRPAGPGSPSRTRPQAAAPATFMLAVTDQTGRLVPNVKVVLSNAITGEGKEGATDQSGEFRAVNLAPGDYRLKASRPGFKTLALELKLMPGQLTTSRATLQLGMLAETVVVSAQPGARPAAVGSVLPGVATPTGTTAPQARRMGSAPTEDPCGQSAEGGCVTPPRKLVDAKPIYPAWAVETGASGTVVIKGRVGTDGRVGNLEPGPDANPDFADAAMRAIRLWEFSPTGLNGVPQEVQIEVTVKFVAEAKK